MTPFNWRWSARRARRGLALTGLLFALSMPAATSWAAESTEGPIDVRGRFTFWDMLPDGDGNQARVKMELVVHLSTLMGEPVVYCTGRWDLDSVRIGNRDYRQSDVPPEVWRGVDLVGVNFAFPVTAKVSGTHWDTAALPCDPGVFYAHGDKRASFNVPGSPSWDQLILHARWLDGVAGIDSNARSKASGLPGAFVPKAQVKAWLIKRQLVFNVDGRGASKGTLTAAYDLISGGVNLWSVRTWAEDQDRQELAKRKESRRQKQVAASASNSKLDDVFAEVDSAVHQREDQARNKKAAAATSEATRATQQRAALLKSQECAPANADRKMVDTTSLTEAADRAMKLYSSCDRSELAKFETDTVNGFKNKSGAVVVSIEKSRAKITGPLSDGVFPASASPAEMERLGLPVPKYGDALSVGYMNLKGEWEIGPKFESASPFSEGIASAGRYSYSGSSYGLIDRRGQWINDKKYCQVSAFSGGAAAVVDVGQCRAGPSTHYLVNKQGNAIFSERYRDIRPAGHGIFAVDTSKSWNRHDPNNYGYMDATGRWFIQPRYNEAGIFSEGITWVCEDDYKSCSVIDMKGNIISQRKFRWPHWSAVFKDGLLVTQSSDSNKYGAIDRTGRFVIEPTFDYIETFDNGTAKAITTNCQRTRIDRQGNLLETPSGSCAVVPTITLHRN